MSLQLAIRQIQFARNYILSLLGGIEDSDWFAMPPQSPTHLAWQVGHVAMAQYGLCLFRIRGRQEIDTELMSSSFRKLFSKGSIPDADAGKYPPPVEIRATFDRVYEQVMIELPQVSEAALSEPVDMPYVEGYPNKLGALLMCSHHEFLHAGQIGLIRRLLGMPPVR
ncbi:MAG: DinB family protein [Pirellulaceae bacterium]